MSIMVATMTLIAWPVAASCDEKTEGTFVSNSKGYSLDYPDSWRVEEGIRDIFWADTQIDGFTPNVSVSCEPVESGTSTISYLRGTKERMASDVNITEEVGVLVDASPAVSMVLRTDSQGRSVEQAVVLLTRGQCGWQVTLTVPTGSLDQDANEFRQIVETFRPER